MKKTISNHLFDKLKAEKNKLSEAIKLKKLAEINVDKTEADICHLLTGIKKGYIIKKNNLLYRVNKLGVTFYESMPMPWVMAIRVNKSLRVINGKMEGGGYDDKIYIDSDIKVFGSESEYYRCK